MPFNFVIQPAYLLRTFLLSLVIFICLGTAFGQEVRDTVTPPLPDSTVVAKDTTVAPVPPVVSDSVVKRPPFYDYWEPMAGNSLAFEILKRHPYYGFGATPVIVYTGLKKFQGKDLVFYTLVGMLLMFALLRQAFPKYFNDLFRLLFRTTLKQKQVREQLMQTPLPSLLLNIFFVMSTGLYINILLDHYHRSPVQGFWLMYMYCMLGLAGIYTVKFVGLKISGWIFNLKEAADTYIFIVFIINKVIGVFLLPFIVFLSFMKGNEWSVAAVLSWCGIGILIIARFLLAYTSIRKQVKFNPFHFFLYLCAFELAPLLLIYKALLFFFQ